MIPVASLQCLMFNYFSDYYCKLSLNTLFSLDPTLLDWLLCPEISHFDFVMLVGCTTTSVCMVAQLHNKVHIG
jgi:hypothetical protein